MAKTATVRPFGMRDKLGYMIGNIGNDLTFFFASSYFMVFYTNVVGVSAGMVGILFGVARLVDAFTDIGMGAIADNGKNKGEGKFRPWLKRIAIPVGVASIIMYNIFIQDWSLTNKIIYMFFTYLLWGSICYTAINIPYGSLASVISPRSEDRAELSTFRSLGSVATQIILGFLVPAVIYDQNGNVQSTPFFILAIVLGVLAMLAYLACYFMVTERVELPETDEKFSLKEFFQDIGALITNRGFLGLMLSTMFVLMGQIAFGQLVQYVYMDYFSNTTWLPIATIGLTIGGLVAAPFVSKITINIGKKEAGSVSLITAGVIFLIMYFLKIENAIAFAVTILLVGIAMGYYVMAMYSYVTDVIDDYEVNQNTRKDGTIYSVYSFIRKVGQALAGLVAGGALTAIGYQEAVAGQSVQQSAQVASGIYDLATLVPGISLLLAGIILLVLYPLSKSRVEENSRILEERR